MDWWKNYFDEIYLKLYSFLENPEAVKKQCDFIEKAMELKKICESLT